MSIGNKIYSLPNGPNLSVFLKKMPTAKNYRRKIFPLRFKQSIPHISLFKHLEF